MKVWPCSHATVHAQRKPTPSISTEARPECLYVLDGVPVISASEFKGSLGFLAAVFNVRWQQLHFQRSLGPLL